jgi:hypothetical protein
MVTNVCSQASAMREHELTGLSGVDPLGFLAAVGLLRVVSRRAASARLQWVERGSWIALLHLPGDLDLVEVVHDDVERWRAGHPAVDFAVGADRKIQDLKHPPAELRELMRELVADPEASRFAAAYGTGVAIDGTGQSKPTALHFCAGQQRFMDAVLDLRDAVTREDIAEALHGPWIGRVGAKDLRWRAASERSRALLSFDPSTEKSATVAGAVWLAFQALPLFPVVPNGLRAVTTGFSGRGKRERFAWPVWSAPLSEDAVRVLVGTPGLTATNAEWRAARGVVRVFESAVVRSAQGYGNFAAADPR